MSKSNHFPSFMPAYNVFNHFNFSQPNGLVRGQGREISLFKLHFHEGTSLHMFIGHLSFINEETEVKYFTQYYTANKW